MGSLRVDEKRKRARNLQQLFLRGIDTLYRYASSCPNFVGTDNWSYFSSLDNVIDHTADVENVVVVLTDGYIEFENTVQERRKAHPGRLTAMDMNSLRGTKN